MPATYMRSGPTRRYSVPASFTDASLGFRYLRPCDAAGTVERAGRLVSHAMDHAHEYMVIASGVGTLTVHRTTWADGRPHGAWGVHFGDSYDHGMTPVIPADWTVEDMPERVGTTWTPAASEGR